MTNSSNEVKTTGSGGAKKGSAEAETSKGKPNPLTLEQNAMWRQRHRDTTKTLGPDEKKAHNQRLKKQLQEMTPDALAKLKKELQGEWDTLPTSRKDKLRAKFDS